MDIEDLAGGFPQELGGVFGLEFGEGCGRAGLTVQRVHELIHPFLQQVGRPVEQLALFHRVVGLPHGEGGLGGVDGPAGILAAAVGHPGEDLAGVRVAVVVELAAHGVHPRAADVHFLAVGHDDNISFIVGFRPACPCTCR